ncbi:28S ribosomal protein S18b, mitochondrial isoform X1 [Alosa sapidissima]|uniref:28S ribosomal protein S18b, mitochondrial isoform X1 n=1 Tax=Alosa sapidissima TaxID=34773 RepID=UPI001C09D5D1|nr:28S ribosomal protein S18b, mitochondrial isoform X1 [Alosa sapidissima]
MAAPLRSIGRLFCRTNIVYQSLREVRGGHVMLPVIRHQDGSPCVQVNRSFCTPASSDNDVAATLDALSRYKDRPWDYLESEEYIERYGSKPVWVDYRRNHKGGIPPQKTRRTCIRGDKICGNPCPICRDPNVIIHHQNVKLLQQFVSPYTGLVLDPTRTGVCMKQQKHLNQAIETARDHGLMPVQVPHVDFSGEDYSNSHAAVGKTPPSSAVKAGEPWYHWYETMIPDERELARVKKIYKPYLKQ